MKKKLRQILVSVLCVLMILSSMQISSFAEGFIGNGNQTDSETVAEETAPADLEVVDAEASGDIAGSEIASEEADTPQDGADVSADKSADTDVDNSASDAKDVSDSDNTADKSDQSDVKDGSDKPADADKADNAGEAGNADKSDKTTDSIDKSDKTTDSIDKSDKTTDESGKDSQEADKTPKTTVLNETVKVGDVTVKMHAPEGVFPEGATLSVKEIKDESELAKVENKVSQKTDLDDIVYQYPLDIKVLDKDGKKIQPDTKKGTPEVTVTFDATVREVAAAEELKVKKAVVKAVLAELGKEDYTSKQKKELYDLVDYSVAASDIKVEVYHIDGSSIDKLDAKDTNENVKFDTESFSPFVPTMEMEEPTSKELGALKASLKRAMLMDTSLESLLQQINDLPDASEINDKNAKAVYNSLVNIQNLMEHYNNVCAANKPEDADIIKGYTDYVKTTENTKKLDDIDKTCKQYLKYVTYQVTPTGLQKFTVIWNDNNDHSSRAQYEGSEKFLDDANVVLSYIIVSEDGSTVVDSGVIRSLEDAQEAFEFLGTTITDVLDIKTDKNEAYTIMTGETMPTRYVSTYTDYATGDIVKTTFKIEYSINLENPQTDKYVVTAPEGANNDSITLKNGEKTIFTQMTDFEAFVQWLDDDNRNINGTPRVGADVLKAHTKVYVFPDGYNATTGTLVTGDYEYEISDTPNAEGYYPVSIKGLPGYDNDGNPLAYYIVQEDALPAANAGAVTGNRYEYDYHNVGNFAAKTDGLFEGGYLVETLTNERVFTVNKVWIDALAKTPEKRPNATYSIWRTVPDFDDKGNMAIDREFAIPIPYTSSEYDVPKAGGNTAFDRKLTNGTSSTIFPMYDTEGRLYVYFGKETNIPGYKTTIDLSTSSTYGDVKSQFEGSGYFVDGATITNEADNTVPMKVSKSFAALAVQNKLDEGAPISTTFLLQKKDAEGKWVNASKDDILSISPAANAEVVSDAEKVEVTLIGFNAEDMNDSYGGIVAKKYYKLPKEPGHESDPDEYDINKYRFIETEISVNEVTSKLDPAKWNEVDGKLVYDEDVVVNLGQKSPVLGDAKDKTSGPNETTALFAATGDGSHFDNQLIGKSLIDIKKFWSDAEGKNIAGDDSLKNAKVTFQIYRDDVPIPVSEGGQVTLTIADLSKDKSCWEKLVEFDRYDESGREYRFKVEEVNVDGVDFEFVATENYERSVVEYEDGDKILVPRLDTKYYNGPGPGNVLYFDVEKEWLDDSDQETRNPVYAAIYRIKDIHGNPLAAPELITDKIQLNTSNNWFRKYTLSVEAGDSVDNYIIVEDSILTEKDRVKLVNAGSILKEFNLLNVKSTVKSKNTEIGIVGDKDAVDADWDGLSYRYRSFTHEKVRDKAGHWTSYTLTNLRIGTQDYLFEKFWNSGATIKDARFGLYHDDKKVGTFDLIVNEDGESIQNPVVTWEPGFDHTGVAIIVEDEGLSKDSKTGNYRENIKVTGLPKFDDMGVQQNYSIKELAIRSDDNSWIDAASGSCKVDGVTYSIGYNSSQTYAPNETHRSPDLYQVQIKNSVSGSDDLVANKVWRDDLTTPRPDVTYSLYRISTKDAEIAKLVADLDDPAKHDAATEALSAMLSGKISKANLVEIDKYWDTKINDFWWTCTMKGLPRFDGNGYPYVYFGIERINSKSISAESGVVYNGYYCNLTESTGYRPTNSGDTSKTQNVFGIPNDELAPLSGKVFIVSDGVHTGSDGQYKSYYSATVVNRIESDRTISGRKLWKFPLGMSVDEQYLPKIEIQLYRSLEEIEYTDATDLENLLKAKAEKITVAGKETQLLNSTIIDNSDAYRYHFSKVSGSDEPLQRYDQWGSLYYYYTLEGKAYDAEGNELAEIHNFPRENAIYQGNNFNISNVYESITPFVEVSLEKVWEVSDKALADFKNGLKATELAPADFILYGTALTSAGNKIDNTKTEYNRVTLDPAAALTASKTDDNGATYEIVSKSGGKNVVKATYTFKTFINDVMNNEEQNLPYYWINGCRVQYSIEEKIVNGYSVYTDKVDPIVFSAEPVTKGGVETYVTDPAQMPHFDNVYEDNQFTDVEFKKIWNDKYVANDEYRPDGIRFVIGRKVGNTVDSKWSQTVDIPKEETSAIWSVKLTDLLKYDPAGKEYTYYIVSEAFLTKSGSSYTAGPAAKVEGDKLGNYTLVNKADTAFTNQLTEETEVSYNKTWTINGETVLDWTNSSKSGIDDLRKLGALPDSVTYIVERKVSGGTWDTVDGSDYEDAARKVTYKGATVLGRTISIKDVTENNYKDLFNSRVKWQHLPKADKSSKAYEYRVFEVLTWADGTTTELKNTDDKSKDIIQATDITTTGDAVTPYSTSLTNNILTKTARIGKIWYDNNGSENTRPENISITIKALDESGNPKGDGFTFTLKTTEQTITTPGAPVTYLTDKFEIPRNIDTIYGMTSGNTYEITESFVAKNGAVYTQTISSGDGKANITTESDGTLVFNIKNTYDTDRKTVNLEALKTWKNDETWKDITRPELKFKLQYYDRTEKKWKDITSAMMEDFSSNASQAPVQTVPVTDTDADRKVTWTNMYKYWSDPSKDGIAEPIRYQVVEVIDNTDAVSSYSNSAQEFAIADNTVTASKTITNTINTYQLNLTKGWTKNGQSTSDWNKGVIEKLINLKAIPEYLEFTVEYKDGDTWKAIPAKLSNTAEPGVFNKKTLDLASNAQNSGFQLPKYDAAGHQIQYRVRETGFKYKDESSFTPVTWNEALTEGTYDSLATTPTETFTMSDMSNNVKKVNVNNEYKFVEKEITKVWIDESNRDGARDNFSVTLNRDGKRYGTVKELSTGADATVKGNNFVTVTKNSDNTWKVKYTLLPKYQKDKIPADGNESVYTWEESTVPKGYTPTYDPEGEDRTTATNVYVPQRGSLSATKAWNEDAGWGEITEASSIDVKLQYKKGESGTWTDVTTGSLDSNSQYADGDVHTTDSSITKTITRKSDGTYTTVSWANLPLYVNDNSDKNTHGKTTDVYYQVVETSNPTGYTFDYLAKGTTKIDPAGKGVILTSAAASDLTVYNKLDSTTVNVSKTWKKTDGTTETSMSSDDMNKLIALSAIPEKVVVQIEYQLDGTDTWTVVPNTTSTKEISMSDLTKSGGYTISDIKLPKVDKNNKAIKYRVRELSGTYKDGHSVTFAWSGDNARAGSVTTTPSTTGAQSGTSKPSVALTNVYEYTEKTYNKNWRDEENRDNVRGDIKVTLYRGTSVYGSVDVATNNADGLNAEFCTVDKSAGDDKWTVKWTMLPKYKDGTTTLEEYKWVESAVNTDYAADTADAVNGDIDNFYQPIRGNIKVTKNWSDKDNSYGTRPAKVYVKLQWREKNSGGSWADVTKGNLVTGTTGKSLYMNAAGTEILTADKPYMSNTEGVDSALWVELSDTNSWQFMWSDLSKYIKTGKEIEYKVVEGVKSGSTIVEIDSSNKLSGYTVSYSDEVSISSTQSGVVKEDNSLVTNTMDLGKIVVTKVFTENGSAVSADQLYKLVKQYKVLPESLKIKLQYTKLDGTLGDVAEKTITFDAAKKAYTTATFDELPVKFSNGNDIQYTITDDADGFGCIDYGTTANVTVSKWEKTGDETAADITNNIDTGKLQINKTWDDESNREKYRSTVTINLYRDGGKTPYRTWTSTTTDDWSCAFEGLPMYKEDGSGDKSEYTVEETGVNSHYTVTWDADKYIVNTKGQTVTAKLENQYAPKKGEVSVTKSWDDADNYYGMRPTQVEFTLMWSDKASPADTDYVAVGTAGASGNVDGGVYAAESATQTADVAATAAGKVEVKWTNLPAYHEGKEITYKVVETALDGYKTPVYTSSDRVKLADGDQAVKVKNTLDDTDLTVTKVWNPDEAQLEDWNALPESITVELQYLLDGVWTKVPENATEVITPDSNGVFTYTYENLNNSYEYRAIEIKVGDLDVVYDTADKESGACGSFKYEAETVKNAAGSYATTITNTIPQTELEVTKTWDDEEDRDTLRKDLTVKLYRDLGKDVADATDEEKAAALIDTVTLTKDSGWTYKWTQLPYYKNGSDTDESVYTIEEVQNDGYKDPEYADSASVQFVKTADKPDGYAYVDITNIHNPVKGMVSAEKSWIDMSDYYGDRPDSIYMTLKYKLKASDDWKIIDTAKLNANDNYADGGVHTTSDFTQKIESSYDANGNSQIATWEDLPLTVTEEGKTSKVIYKVFETDASGKDIIGADAEGATLKNYDITYGTEGDIIADEAGNAVTQEITNTLELTELTLNKSWSGDEAAYNKDGITSGQLVRPDKIEYYVEYMGDSGEWEPLTQVGETPVSKDGAVTVIESEIGEWESVTIDNLPLKTPEGKDYQYRAREAKIYFGEDVITCTMSETADKSFDGIAGAYEGTSETSMSKDVWTCETVNALETGKIAVEKIWNDSMNRDGMRPEEITLDLHRVDKMNGTEIDTVIDTVTITEDSHGDWHYEWKNLPVMTRDGSEKALYYVTEEDVTGYDVAVDGGVNAGDDALITVTNEHTPLLVNISADKIWKDNTNHYGLRDKKVALTLQYSLDGGKTWADDIAENTAVTDRKSPAEDEGTTVYSESANRQVITGDKTENTWTGAEWTGLSAYVLGADGNSVKVLYRVVEAEGDIPVSYTMTESAGASYIPEEDVDGSSASDVSVTNKLTDVKSISATKVWDTGSDVLKSKAVLPDYITVQLQYSADGEVWKNVPENSEAKIVPKKGDTWSTVTFKGLRADLEYRIVEVSATWTVEDETKTVYVKDSEGKKIKDAEGFLGSFVYTSEITYDEANKAYDEVIYNAIDETCLTVVKKWKDYDNADKLRKPVTVNVYRDLGVKLADATKADKKAALIASVVLTAGNDWTYTWTNLPMYKDGSDKSKSVYTIEEIPVKGYETTYSDQKVKFDDKGAAKVVITNKHTPDDPDKPNHGTDPDNPHGGGDGDDTDRPGKHDNYDEDGDNPGGNGKVPYTGDNSHMMLWVLLMGIGFAGMSGTYFYGRKRKQEK